METDEEYYKLDEFLCYTGLLFYNELSEETQHKIHTMSRHELIQRMYIIGDMRFLLDPKESIDYINLDKSIKNCIDDNSGDPFIHRMFNQCYRNQLIPPGGFITMDFLEEKLSNYGKPRVCRVKDEIRFNKRESFKESSIIEILDDDHKKVRFKDSSICPGSDPLSHENARDFKSLGSFIKRLYNHTLKENVV